MSKRRSSYIIRDSEIIRSDIIFYIYNISVATQICIISLNIHRQWRGLNSGPTPHEARVLVTYKLWLPII